MRAPGWWYRCWRRTKKAERQTPCRSRQRGLLALDTRWFSRMLLGVPGTVDAATASRWASVYVRYAHVRYANLKQANRGRGHSKRNRHLSAGCEYWARMSSLISDENRPLTRNCTKYVDRVAQRHGIRSWCRSVALATIGPCRDGLAQFYGHDHQGPGWGPTTVDGSRSLPVGARKNTAKIGKFNLIRQRKCIKIFKISTQGKGYKPLTKLEKS